MVSVLETRFSSSLEVKNPMARANRVEMRDEGVELLSLTHIKRIRMATIAQTDIYATLALVYGLLM